MSSGALDKICRLCYYNLNERKGGSFRIDLIIRKHLDVKREDVTITRVTGDLVEIPPDWERCKVTLAGNVVECQTFMTAPRQPDAVKIDRDHYVTRSDGEVHEYKHAENKSQSSDSVRKTLTELRRIINTNCVRPECVRWVTLTYRQDEGVPVRDTTRVCADYEKMWKKLQRWCASNQISKPEYITVLEPQASGAWHLHCLWIWESKAPNIPKNRDVLVKLGLDPELPTLESMWGQGFVSIKSASTDCDNIGAYMSAYLADIPLDDVLKQPNAQSDLMHAEIKEVNDKRYIKGGRLHYYPSGIKLYRCSRGIRRPEVEWTTYGMAKKEMIPPGSEITYKKHVDVNALDKMGDAKTVQAITTIYYNTKSKKSK